MESNNCYKYEIKINKHLSEVKEKRKGNVIVEVREKSNPGSSKKQNIKQQKLK